MVRVCCCIARLSSGWHCPPDEVAYLMPKSPFLPPGLCEADNTNPPSSLFFKIICEPAGVETIPSFPM